MSYCQNCGTEVVGNFCSNCGTEVGGYNQTNTRVYENVKIVPRYSTGAIVLAGYLGFVFLLTALIIFIPSFFYFIGGTLNFGEFLIVLIAAVCVFGIAYLCYRPGLKSIRKYSPEGTAARARRGFFLRSVLFIWCWGLTIAGCVYIIGIFFRVWRLGIWAATPRCDEYTAIIDGQNIGVTKYVDTTLYGDGKTRYIYEDENGNLYRPPLYRK